MSKQTIDLNKGVRGFSRVSIQVSLLLEHLLKIDAIAKLTKASSMVYAYGYDVDQDTTSIGWEAAERLGK